MEQRDRTNNFDVNNLCHEKPSIENFCNLVLEKLNPIIGGAYVSFTNLIYDRSNRVLGFIFIKVSAVF